MTLVDTWHEHAARALKREKRINVSGFRVPSDEAPIPTFAELTLAMLPIGDDSWPCTPLSACHELGDGTDDDCEHHRG